MKGGGAMMVELKGVGPIVKQPLSSLMTTNKG